jgi:hypothetical protein
MVGSSQREMQYTVDDGLLVPPTVSGHTEINAFSMGQLWADENQSE